MEPKKKEMGDFYFIIETTEGLNRIYGVSINIFILKFISILYVITRFDVENHEQGY